MCRGKLSGIVVGLFLLASCTVPIISSPPNSDLVGSWKSASPDLVLTVNEDGTVALSGGAAAALTSGHSPALLAIDASSSSSYKATGTRWWVSASKSPPTTTFTYSYNPATHTLTTNLLFEDTKTEHSFVRQ